MGKYEMHYQLNIMGFYIYVILMLGCFILLSFPLSLLLIY